MTGTENKNMKDDNSEGLSSERPLRENRKNTGIVHLHEAYIKYGKNSEELSNYVEQTNIQQALRDNIEVDYIVVTNKHRLETSRFARKVEAWLINNGLYRETECETYKICGQRGRVWYNRYICSSFGLYTSTDDGYIEDFIFYKPSLSDVQKYKDYDPNFKPTMLQLAYGLKKKHPYLEYQVFRCKARKKI